MTLLHILLIPFKLLVKLLGFILSAILNLIGYSLILIALIFEGIPFVGIFVHIAGIAFAVISVIQFISTEFYNHGFSAWVAEILVFIGSLLFATLTFWVASLGQALIALGENIIFATGEIKLLP
ncbi:MAG: hypothetical protein ACI4J4_10660 [Ruminiclostridium sp.]